MDNQELSKSDLRNMILGLKVSGFAGVDSEEIRNELNFLIKKLPSPELLSYLNNEELNNVKKNIGEVMKLVEKGNKRDENFKIQYEAKKGMPPRHNILKWRKAMNSNEITKSLIKISMYADDKDLTVLADKSLNLAKKASKESLSEEDIKSLDKIITEASLDKEAGIGNWWSGVKGGLGGAWEGAKNVGHLVADPAKANASMAKSQQLIASITQQVQNLSAYLTEASQYVARNPQLQQSITALNQEIGALTPALQKASQGINNVQMNLSGGAQGQQQGGQQQGGQQQGGQQQGGQEGNTLFDAAKQTANEVLMSGPNRGVGDIQPAGPNPNQNNNQSQTQASFQPGQELYYDSKRDGLKKGKFLEYDQRGLAKLEMPDGTILPGVSPKRLSIEKPADYEGVTVSSKKKWVRIA